jgi:hypothetical protein
VALWQDKPMTDWVVLMTVLGVGRFMLDELCDFVRCG